MFEFTRRSFHIFVSRPLTRQQPILLPGEEKRRTSGIPAVPSITQGGASTPPTGTGPPTSGNNLDQA